MELRAKQVSRGAGHRVGNNAMLEPRPVLAKTNAHEGDPEDHSRHGGRRYLGGAATRGGVKAHRLVAILTANAKRSLSVEGIRIRKIVARHGVPMELILAAVAQEGPREGALLI